MVWQALRCRNASALIDHLTALGFVETARHVDGDLVSHAELRWPEGGGVMLGSVKDDAGDPWPAVPGTAACYVVTADPEAVHARALAAGAEIVRAPFDTDHGSRDFSARDPEGNLWSFGTYRGEPRRVS